jgi:hypothetical protein
MVKFVDKKRFFSRRLNYRARTIIPSVGKFTRNSLKRKKQQFNPEIFLSRRQEKKTMARILKIMAIILCDLALTLSACEKQQFDSAGKPVPKQIPAGGGGGD